MIVAVDIGASATKVALWRRDDGEPAALDIEGEYQWSTTLFMDRARELFTGVPLENLARSPRFRGRYVAGVKQQINKVDAETEPLYRELRFPVDGTQPLVRGIGAILAHALTAVPRESGDPARLVLSHPVLWTAAERAVLVEAAAAVAPGVPVTLVSEAEAVGLHMASHLTPDGSYAVVDFGASTFDFAILRHRPEGIARVVYEGGRLIGGDDFDNRILRLVRETADEDELRELRELVTTEADLLRAEAEQVKRTLSSEDEAVFAVRGLEVPVYREDFEEAIAHLVLDCRTLVEEALSALRDDPPHTLVLSGGAARIPCVREDMAALAAGKDAKILYAQEESPGSPVALGALRARTDAPPVPARAVRPFTLTPDVMTPPPSRMPMTAVAGGLAALGPDERLQIWRDDGARRMTPVTLRRTFPASVALTVDPSGSELLLASASPAFTTVRLNAHAEDEATSVFGRLAATPARPEGHVSVLAHLESGVAYCLDEAPTGTVVDFGGRRWDPLRFAEPPSELLPAGPGLLLAVTVTGLLLLDPETRETSAVLDLPAPSSVAVDYASGTVAVSGAGRLSTYTLGPDGFRSRWWRRLPDGGPAAFTAPDGQLAVIVHDTHDRVYRALAADTGRQLALRDAARGPAPDRMYPSPEPGVVYARTRDAVHRIRLEGPPR